VDATLAPREGDSMSDRTDSRGMESLYRDRAKVDPLHSAKWLGQAERWHDLAKQEAAWRFQRRTGQQQMYTEPMAMGSNTVRGPKQQG
jgi:hypothetical protein